MQLVNFSVKNFRSITTAHKISVSNTTILIGKNNEGKSNLLKALDIAMSSLQEHALQLKARKRGTLRGGEELYLWSRDFPISLQSKKTGTETKFHLEFLLSETEIREFKDQIKSSLNGSLPIEITIGGDNKPIVKVQKSGKGGKTLNTKSNRIAEFIANKIVFNYIPAIRTDQEAIEVVRRMLAQHLRVLEGEPAYINALQTIKDLQTPLLETLCVQIMEPLVEFLPGIKSVKIDILDDVRRSSLRSAFDIIVNDGTSTSLAYKGDGVKSLVALGLLKNRILTDGASIIAIEEPESHLHPAAIHQLNEVIMALAEENQVILTTHNPLFVDRLDVKSNIIVDRGKATPARDIKQIRELLGIKASDNLIHASYVLVVEGENDVIALRALLPTLSEKLEKHLKNNSLIIEYIGGAGKLSYQLFLLRISLCVYHTLLDNDESGRDAFKSAFDDGVLSIKSNTFINCDGMKNAEFEDCLNPDIYKEAIRSEYGVNIDSPKFRGSAIWSDRMRDTFLNQAKLWNDKIKAEVKLIVANSVKQDPKNALNVHKRNSIDKLVENLELLIK